MTGLGTYPQHYTVSGRKVGVRQRERVQRWLKGPLTVQLAEEPMLLTTLWDDIPFQRSAGARKPEAVAARIHPVLSSCHYIDVYL